MGIFTRISTTSEHFERVVCKLLEAALQYRLEETAARSINNFDDADAALHRAQLLEARIEKLDQLYADGKLNIKTRA